MQIDRCSTRSHSLENSLGKRLWACRKTDSRMKGFLTVRLLPNAHTRTFWYFCWVIYEIIVWAGFQRCTVWRIWHPVRDECFRFCTVLCGVSESELQYSVRSNLGRGWKSSDFYFNPLVQCLILHSQNYQIKFIGFKIFVSDPLQSICVPQKIQRQPAQADKLYYLYNGTSKS